MANKIFAHNFYVKTSLINLQIEQNVRIDIFFVKMTMLVKLFIIKKLLIRKFDRDVRLNAIYPPVINYK